MKAHLITSGMFAMFVGFTMIDEYFPVYFFGVGIVAAVYTVVYRLIKEFTK